jgi:hypothetical protein
MGLALVLTVLVGLFWFGGNQMPQHRHTHPNLAQTKKFLRRYNIQMQWQMACTARQWCDFASFDPRMSEGLQLFIKRVEYDPVLVATLEKEVIFFYRNWKAKLNNLTN